MSDAFLTHVEDQRTRLKKRQSQIVKELRDLDKAEEIYKKSPAYKALNPERPTSDPAADDGSDADKTIKSRIRAALAGFPNGATSEELLQHIKKNGLPSLERTSFSPQLSRLHKGREISRREGKWFVASKDDLDLPIDDLEEPLEPDDL